MKTKSLGFIGGGRITKILLHAFQNKNAEFSSIVVTDINSEVTASLRQKFPYIHVGIPSEVASQDIVFISLHPPVIMETLESLKDYIQKSTTVISLAPKITLAKISSKLINVNNLARLIPNATSYINEGYNPVTFSKEFEADEKKEIVGLLELLGTTLEVPEEKLESYAILSAMLPTYFWFQWHELSGIGQKIGLNEMESKDSIDKTLIASLNLMFRSGLSAPEVMDLIPVKPIGEHEAQITEIFRTRLTGLYEKIKP